MSKEQNKNKFFTNGHVSDEAIILWANNKLKDKEVSDHIYVCSKCLIQYTHLFTSSQEVSENRFNEYLTSLAREAIDKRQNDDKNKIQDKNIDLGFPEKLKVEAGELNEQIEKGAQLVHEEIAKHELKLSKKHDSDWEKEMERIVYENFNKETPDAIDYNTLNIAKGKNYEPYVVAHSYSESFSEDFFKTQDDSLKSRRYMNYALPFAAVSILTLMLFLNPDTTDFNSLNTNVFFPINEMRFRGETSETDARSGMQWDAVDQGQLDYYEKSIPKIKHKDSELIIYYNRIKPSADKFQITANGKTVTRDFDGRFKIQDFDIKSSKIVDVSIIEYENNKVLSKIVVQYSENK